MYHFDFEQTPLQHSDVLSRELGFNLYIKREDLFDKGGGGSKARMLQYILFKAKIENCDYILTAGGPYSNFNRALALLCGQHGLKMRLVLYDKNPEINQVSLNKIICDYCDVEYVECEPDIVARTLIEEEAKLKKNGHQPFLVWGGGKSNEGVLSYQDCVREMKEQLNFEPNYVITPLGTGTTFAGLTLGCKKYSSNTRVIGISVARKKDLASQVVLEIINDFQDYYNLPHEGCEFQDNIFDEYLLGGYGKSTLELDSFLKNIVKKNGIILDKIYVGKTLFGLLDLNRKSDLFKGKDVVFMNTGGLFNLW